MLTVDSPHEPKKETCPHCGIQRKYLSAHIKKKHGITVKKKRGRPRKEGTEEGRKKNEIDSNWSPKQERSAKINSKPEPESDNECEPKRGQEIDSDWSPKKEKSVKINSKSEPESESDEEYDPRRNRRKDPGPPYDIHNDKLFPCLKYNPELNEFSCGFCSYSRKRKRDPIFLHMKRLHQSELESRADELNKSISKEKYECENKLCVEFYGIRRQELWCESCTIQYQTSEKRLKQIEANKAREKKRRLETQKDLHCIKERHI